MEPLPETSEVLRRMSSTSEVDLLKVMNEAAERVVDAIPGCVGIGITLRDHEITFSWLVTDDRLRGLDAAQFLETGPCEAAAYEGKTDAVSDLMDEEQWRLFAVAGAAAGVRSSLSMPLIGPTGSPFGSVNFYGHDIDTFSGRERRIAEIFGADVQAAVVNADLTMSSRMRAEHAVDTLQDMDDVDVASGILAEREGISPDLAVARLEDAATRADVPLGEVARLVIRERSEAEGSQ